ncbi:uncharacterized protein PAC_10428 [Phialocephala subalpina]|uniref:Rhodopsin domain-containing protein n=1 Tax=Phialocephala subalpina TaxID=576137 RepID=A0A1L7X698_9HELO|nr:uncharacterized protein PAC_10428 [Phialocephala subalpina]
MADPSQVPISAEAHHAANLFVGLTVPLFTAALATIINRIVFKLRSRVRLGLDDGFIVVGFVLATVDWALLMAATAWYSNSSRPFATVSQAQQTVMLGVISVPIWGFSVGFIKISMAFLLLRFQQNTAWRWFLYALIGVIAVVMIASSIFAIVQCLPLAAVWDRTIVGAKCISPSHIRIVSNFVGGFSIATDLVLSLFPLTFIVKLRRPFMEKALISLLMAVGLTASAASITKAVLIQQWVNDIDGLYIGIVMSTLGSVEMLIGSTAACLPGLKSTVQRFLTYCGFDFNSDFSNSHAFFRSIGQAMSLQNISLEPTSRALKQEESSRTDSSKSSAANLETGGVDS